LPDTLLDKLRCDRGLAHVDAGLAVVAKMLCARIAKNRSDRVAWREPARFAGPAMTTRDDPPGALPRGPAAPRLVFVYGTLLAGESNHGLLAEARLVATGRTQPAFQLHDLGACPGLVHGGAHAVVGEVYVVDEPTLAMLDRLEDHPEFYRRTGIVLDDGTSVETYLLTPEQVEGCPVIASGSWRVHAARMR
jgi:gamma-glutamylaminecyclotransferase